MNSSTYGLRQGKEAAKTTRKKSVGTLEDFFAWQIEKMQKQIKPAIYRKRKG